MPKTIVLLLLVVAVGTAYVLGARAGRSRFREISGIAKNVWDDPGVKKVRDATYRKLEKAAKRAAKKL
jgi:hypothetical protein